MAESSFFSYIYFYLFNFVLIEIDRMTTPNHSTPEGGAVSSIRQSSSLSSSITTPDLHRNREVGFRENIDGLKFAQLNWQSPSLPIRSPTTLLVFNQHEIYVYIIFLMLLNLSSFGSHLPIFLLQHLFTFLQTVDN